MTKTARIILILLALVALVGSMAQAAAPTAAFSCTPTAGLSPLPANCNDASTGSPTGWAWFFGDENYSASWTIATASAAWAARSEPTSVALPNGSLILMGGTTNGGTTGTQNATWLSINGSVWVQVNSSSGWPVRYAANSVIMSNGDIVTLSGITTGSALLNDTWKSSSSGTMWILQNLSSGWPARYDSSTVVLPDQHIVIMGGHWGTSGISNDVWRSTDEGVTWQQMTASAAWSARYGHRAVAMPDGSIVLTGGYVGGSSYANDTWRSTDEGATWVQMNASSGYPAEMLFGAVSMPDASILLFGGAKSGGVALQNNMWRSINNGAIWVQVNSSEAWTARGYFSTATLPNGTVALMAGYDGAYKNDVWLLDPTGSHAQNPTHTYAAPGTYNVTEQVWNSAGYGTLLKSNYESVYGSPFVKFSVQKTTGTGQSLATFTDLSTNATAWNWSFQPSSTTGGNGTQVAFSTLQSPTLLLHPGNYSIIENITNPTSTYNTSAPIWINVSAVTAAFSGTPLSGQTPLSVSFTDASIGSPSQFTYFFGDENYTSGWALQNASSGWIGRSASRSVVLPDGHIILFGGLSSAGTLNDVWRSIDKGLTWQQINASTGYLGTNLPGMVAMPDGSIRLIGGLGSGGETNQTWASYDEGVTWAVINTSPGWTARSAFPVVVAPDNSIILMGGVLANENNPVNDTWRSTDGGKSWIQMTAQALWVAKGYGSAVAMPDSNIILIGGTIWPSVSRTNDTWKSSDYGATWSEINISSGFPARDHISPMVMPDGSIIFSGGNTGIPTYSNDTWRSTDEGKTWALVNYSSGFSARYDLNSILMPDGSIVQFGGYNGNYLNDTWRMAPQGSNLQSPIHQYTTPGIYSVSEMVTGAFGSNTLTQSNYITAYPNALTAIFDANNTAGYYPLLTQFYDQSTGTPTAWKWDFGDGSSSTVQNPSHTYASAGQYYVNLTVTNAFGTTSLNKTKYINVLSSTVPVVDFWANNPTISGQATGFVDSSTNNPTSWYWMFGDGSISTTQNPSHTYAAYGYYTVNHSATNQYGTSWANKTSYVLIEPSTPTIITQFTGTPTTGLASLTVNFADTSLSFPSAVSSWAWTFGDGGTATTQNPVHVYTAPGTYSVSLTTTNANVTNSTTYASYITATAPIPSTAFVKSFNTAGGTTAININRFHYGTLTMTNPDTGAPIYPAQTITYLPDSTTLDTIPVQPAIAFTGDDGSYWVYRTV